MDEKGLGLLLQNARKSAGLTQQQLCQRSGLSYSTLAKIERGAIRSPSIFTIQQIAEALNTSVDQLLTGVSSHTSGGKKRSKTGITFVYFDVNGCLVRFVERAFGAIAADVGVDSDVVEAVYVQYNDAVCKGIMSLDEFNTILGRTFEVSNFNWSDYYMNAIEGIAESSELLSWAAQHYRVGLITNIMPGLVPALMQQGYIPELPYESIIDSSEVKLIKPDPAIFQLATEHASVPTNEILLVDDTPLNIHAAERTGWQGLLFNDLNPKESVQSVRRALAF
jgi:FMN phosphatase YigB (HAD superfamily)/DNA-binding XRE family transcriptional regulator